MSAPAPTIEPRKRTGQPIEQLRATAPRHSYRILAVADGTERTNLVVDFIASFAAYGRAVEVILLNVQSQRREHRLRGYQTFKRGEINDRLINEVGMPIVTSITRRLEKLGIAARGRVEIGDAAADVILKYAAEEHCDLVVIGAEPPNVLSRFLARTFGVLSGTAARLAARSDRPIVLVK